MAKKGPGYDPTGGAAQRAMGETSRQFSDTSKAALDFLTDSQKQYNKQFGKDIKGIPVIRPAGRRTQIERNITNILVDSGLLMKRWLVENDRVATGRALNSIKVKITRQIKPGAAISKGFSAAAGAADAVEGASGVAGGSGRGLGRDIRKAQNIFNNLDIGLVNGQVVGTPHLRYALEGRPSGKAPPQAAIALWMAAKGVAPRYRNSPYVIARSIGAKGTQGPHFTDKILTNITRASVEKSIRLIATPFAKAIGRRFVRHLLKAGELYDNIDFTSDTVTPYNESQDQD